jgi:predicted nucleic acid-binding protein
MSGSTVLESTAVVNASPVITFAKSGLLRVLTGLFPRIVAPRSVLEEIGKYDDLPWKAISSADWIDRQTVSVDPRLLGWNLGKGESEVLSLALGSQNHIAVIDDLAARKCAVALKIQLIGTAGVLVLASRFKLIPSLETAFSKVREAGLYLRDDLVRNLLESESFLSDQ